MTRFAQDVFAAEPSQQGRQGSHLLVAGGDRAHSRWSAPENPLLSGRAEQFRAGALAENGRGLQRPGRSPATEAVPVACGGAAGRSAGGARAGEPSAPGEDAAVRRLLSGTAIVEAPGTGSFLRAGGG